MVTLGKLFSACYLESAIRADSFIKNKITVISGPRQVGKTTLSKALLHDSDNYFSYDQESFRRAWAKSPEAALAHRSLGPVVLDEIHKDRMWKRKLKGIFDGHSEGRHKLLPEVLALISFDVVVIACLGAIFRIGFIRSASEKE